MLLKPGARAAAHVPSARPAGATGAAESLPFTLNESEIEFVAIRASGPGGQNVNKVSNAVQLRFDVPASTLSDELKLRLLAVRDQRISGDGVVVIRAQQERSLERNRAAALQRLHALVAAAARTTAPRVATQPTRASRQRRLQAKAYRGAVKAGRARVGDDG